MYIVTWPFRGTKQRHAFNDIIGAERRKRELNRIGIRGVKIEDDTKLKGKPCKIWIDEYKDIAQIVEVLEESELMPDDLQDARVLAIKMRKNGFTKEAITQRLNDEFDPTFFYTKDGIFARNEPDYLPERKVLTWQQE